MYLYDVGIHSGSNTHLGSFQIYSDFRFFQFEGIQPYLCIYKF